MDSSTLTDLPFDSSWCPVCSRQILPKRITVPVGAPATTQQQQLPPTTPAPPPSPTTSNPTTSTTRTKGSKTRTRGGLVHGTGRVKPNGTIRRTEQQAPASQPQQPPRPIRTRTIIDQNPLPLYCSDDCRLADLQSSYGSTMDINYHPDRHSHGRVSPSLPPVPHNSLTNLPTSASPPEDTVSDSSASTTSISSASPPTLHLTPGRIPTMFPSHGSAKTRSLESCQESTRKAWYALSTIYDMPPCPAPPPLIRSDTESSTESVADDYTSGIMVASRRITEALQPAPKRPSWVTPSAALSTQYALGSTSRSGKNNDVIPGWTDGSNAWRSQVYPFAAPSKDDKTRYIPTTSVERSSAGVVSTLGEKKVASTSQIVDPQVKRSNSELLGQFESKFFRRSDSRTSLAHQGHLSTSPTSSVRSLPVSTRTTKEVSIVAKQAEGKLLVPKVKLVKRTSSSTEAVGSEWDGTSMGSGGRRGSMKSSSARSPLSRQGSMVSEISECVKEEVEDDDTVKVGKVSRMGPGAKKRLEARSWSYSDVNNTYAVMPSPPVIEKRFQKEVGPDGVERLVQVEVLVKRERKPLFIFPATVKPEDIPEEQRRYREIPKPLRSFT